MIVGGEFYSDPAWLRDAPSLDSQQMVFLNGGKACLIVISDYLREHGIHKVLLPAYLCPSIVKTFEGCGIAWDFYAVNEDLSLDLEDLARKAPAFRAVYFINYFGFFHAPETQDFLRGLQQNGTVLIEDNAQAGFPGRQTGDFSLNSLRKLAAYDGGYLITRQDVAPYLQKYQGLPNRRLALIRAYRAGLYPYLSEGRGSYEELNGLFLRATEYYDADWVVLGDSGERQQIERLDWAGMKQTRRENYRYLMEWVRQIPEITPIYPELQAENMPFGLPVYFEGVARDPVYESLGKAGIGLTIHWEELCSDPRTNQNRRAVGMASRMLTLVIDQRIRRKQMDYLAMQLIQGIKAAKAEI
jgi:hypothetical protein